MAVVGEKGLHERQLCYAFEKITDLGPGQLFYSQWGHGKEAGRLIDLTREYTLLCGEIIIRGIREGESEKTIMQKLLPYMDFDDRYIPSEPLRKIFKAFGIQPFLEYFKRLGIGL